MSEVKSVLIKHVGNLVVNATSDIYDGKLGDTQIIIEAGVLCCVSGQQRKEFLDKLSELILEYQI